MSIVIQIVTAITMVAASPTVFAKPAQLGISKPVLSNYLCEDGSKIKASFYSLTDDSLSFVKLKVDGKNYTLPLVVSASGNRYTDLLKIELFTKGKSATLSKDVNNDKAKLVNCKV